MTSRKQKTGKRKYKTPATALSKPLEEGINKDKRVGYRRLLAKAHLDEAAKRIVKTPEDTLVVVELIGDNEWVVQSCARGALWKASETDHETRVAITKALMQFMDSHEFIVEKEKNSPLYVEMIGRLEGLARKIDQLERQAAWIS